ncbi:hypothetical protein MB46_19685 (plasmid) [Arthrobacter alpinus]|uniref:alpha/beta hydrolase n=1 Tax=Arthrobacter alpinus TaxID=656366 RepID=UPI0005CA004F|nr:alpha/beta hydrolase [Arthrobacter alpinus]ALV47893.1 hypothetical protein MB46_19685 [Arthrobacter alpinus]
MPTAEFGSAEHDNSPSKTPKTVRRRRVWLFGLGIVTAVLVIVAACFIAWANTTYPTNTQRLSQVRSDTRIVYEELDNVIRLKPAEAQSTQGLIFLVGAKVEPQSYAATLSDAAAEGTTVLIVRPPLNLALLQFDSFETLTRYGPGVQTWAVGGHSMGGVKACTYAQDSRVTKLLLFASYCSSDTLAKRSDLEVLSLQGSQDKVIKRENLENFSSLMPEHSQIITLNGVTHAQFGDYGQQSGDGTADVTTTEAHQLISEQVLPFLAGEK